MEENSQYAVLISDVIKKQIAILGPDIALLKARNVEGIVISNDGTVISITGNPQKITQDLVNQFIDLSGLIVKNAMETLLAKQNQTAIQPTASLPIVPENHEANNIPAFPQQEIQNILDNSDIPIPNADNATAATNLEPQAANPMPQAAVEQTPPAPQIEPTPVQTVNNSTII